MKEFLLAIAVAVSMIVPASAVALPTTSQVTAPTQQVAACASGIVNFFGIQSWHACLPKTDDGSPKITKLTDLLLIVFPIVDALIKIAVYVTIVYIFWMIIKIIMARGESGKVAQASLGIRDAVIGLVIALVAVAIVNFIAGAVTGG